MGVRHSLAVFAFTLVAAMASVMTATGETCELTYRQADGGEDEITRAVSMHLSPLPGPLSNHRNVDARSDEIVSYFSLTIARSTIAMAVLRRGDEVPPRLLIWPPGKDDYVNISISDDKQVVSGLPKGYSCHKFGPFELPVGPGRDGSLPKVMAEVNVNPRSASLTIRTEGYFCGKMSLGSSSFSVAVADANFSGKLGDVLQGGASDKLFIDLDQDGKFDPKGECFPLMGVLGLDGEYYRLKTSPDGSSIVTESAQLSYGTLEIKCPELELLLFSDTCCSYFSACDAPLRLPPGRYTVLSFSLKKDAEGKTWKLRGSRPTQAMMALVVGAGQNIRLAMGTPLDLKIDANHNSGVFKINLNMMGAAGEEYSPMVSPGAPEFKIVDENDRVLQEGKFQPG
jgi:hypothetical protein